MKESEVGHFQAGPEREGTCPTFPIFLFAAGNEDKVVFANVDAAEEERGARP